MASALVPKDDQALATRKDGDRDGQVVPAEAVAIVTQCSRVFVENAANQLAVQQQQHANLLDSRFNMLVAELEAWASKSSRSNDPSVIQHQMNDLYRRISFDVGQFVDQRMRHERGEVVNYIAATKASDRCSSVLAQRELTKAVRDDALSSVQSEIAGFRGQVQGHIQQAQEAERLHITDQLVKLRSEFASELQSIRESFETAIAAADKQTLSQAHKLIEDEVELAMVDARGVIDNQIKRAESRLKGLIESQASAMARNFVSDHHLRLLRDHVDSQIRNVRSAMDTELARSQLRAETSTADFVAINAATEEQIRDLIRGRVDLELQDVDQRIQQKLATVQDDVEATTRALFSEIELLKRSSLRQSAVESPSMRGETSEEFEKAFQVIEAPAHQTYADGQDEILLTDQRQFGSFIDDIAPNNVELQINVSASPPHEVGGVDPLSWWSILDAEGDLPSDDTPHGLSIDDLVTPESGDAAGYRPPTIATRIAPRPVPNTSKQSAMRSRSIDEARLFAQAQVVARAEMRARQLKQRAHAQRTNANVKGKPTTGATAASVNKKCVIWGQLAAARATAKAIAQKHAAAMRAAKGQEQLTPAPANALAHNHAPVRGQVGRRMPLKVIRQQQDAVQLRARARADELRR